MSKPVVVIVIGARPEVIRMALLIKALNKYPDIDVKVLHTGQHYSKDMDQIFFDELGIAPPYVNLGVGSAAPYRQMARIIGRAGVELKKLKPALVCVWGDTNSSLGVAIAANKLRLKLAHLEGGCRSHDARMAEEYNRRMIDHISDILFPLSMNDQKNLEKESIMGKVYGVGDPLYDIYNETVASLKPKGLVKKLGLGKKHAVLTLHRAENVDDKKTLERILRAVLAVKTHKIFFPIHPRTKKMVDKFGLNDLLKSRSFVVTPPASYLDLLEVLMSSEFAITDSGGFQKEVFFTGIPCITVRESTEWLDTVRLGMNVLADPTSEKELKKIAMVAKNLLKYKKIMKSIKEKPYGDGKASQEIAKIIYRKVNSR